MQRTIVDYLDAARIRRGIPSDSKLSVALGLAQPSVFAMRKRRILPSVRTMLKLADLAGIDQDVALLELAQWQATSVGANDAVEVYKRIARKAGIAAAVATVAVMTAITPLPASAGRSANVDTHNVGTVYITGNRRRRRLAA